MAKKNRDALEQEIVNKIEEMEKPQYIFPERFPRSHFILAGCCVIVSLVMLVLGLHIG